MLLCFQERKNHGVVTFVLWEDGQIVSTASVVFEQKFIHNGGRIAHLEDVATRKGYEGKGYARQLLERAIELATTRGCYKLILDCSSENVPFYSKNGMRPIEICMRIDLET